MCNGKYLWQCIINCNYQITPIWSLHHLQCIMYIWAIILLKNKEYFSDMPAIIMICISTKNHMSTRRWKRSFRAAENYLQSSISPLCVCLTAVCCPLLSHWKKWLHANCPGINNKQQFWHEHLVAVRFSQMFLGTKSAYEWHNISQNRSHKE